MGGAWSLETTKTTPTTFATATVAGARSAGYNTLVELPAPYLCSTRAKATLDIVSSGVGQGGGMVIIERYF